MTLERRIHLITAIIVLLALVAGLFLFLSSSGVRHGLEQMKTSSEIVRMAFLMRTLMDEYLSRGDERPMKQWLQVNESLGRVIRDTERDETIDGSLLKQLHGRYRDVNDLHGQIIQLGVSENQDRQSKLLKATAEGMMAVRLEELVNAAERMNRSAQSKTLGRQDLAQSAIAAAFLAMIGLIVLNLHLIKKSILQPLRALATAGEIGAAEDGQPHEQMASTGGLTETFQALVDRIKKVQDSLRGEMEQRERAQGALQRLNDELEIRVLDRTAELTEAHTKLEQELSERKKAEESLRESEERLRMAQSSANVGVWEWHLGSGKVMWTEEMERLYGYAEGTFPGTYEGFSERVHPEDLAEVERLYNDAVKASQPFDFDFRIQLPSGETRWVNAKGAAHYDGTGIPHGIFGVNADITARKQAEELLTRAHVELEQRVLDRTDELRQANEKLIVEIDYRKRAEEAVAVERQRLYDILEAMPVMVCLLTPDYHVAFANRSFREKFGESNGRQCYDYCFEKEGPCGFCEAYNVLKTGKPHHWEVAGPDGSVIDAYDFPFTDTDGSPFILEIDIDITERKHAEAALRQTLADLTRSNEDLQQFAYVASHDLQEPLRNVASALQMFEKRHKGKLDQQSDQLIDYAVDGATRMKALISDLLTYSRVATKGQEFEAVDTQEVLDRALRNLKGLVVEKGARITYDQMPTVRGDATQMLQVVQNLIGNAVKFGSHEAPKVHVSAQRNSNQWIFAVKDNGIGIEADQLDRIFVIFQQLNKRGSFAGTGIGLAIVKKIVERHNGRVWVESEVGAGSTFYFSVPDGK